MTKRKSKWHIVIPIILAVLIITGYILYTEIIKKQIYPIKYEDYVVKYSQEYNVPQEYIYAVIYSESSFKEKAVSHAGAIGLMQIMPDTFDWLSRLMGENYEKEDVYKPEINIKCGVFYLSFLYNRFGNWDTAIAGYNAGHGRVSAWLCDTRYSDDGETLKYIPYQETNNYVKKVNKLKNIYLKLYIEE